MRPNKSTKKKYTDKEYDYESLYDTPINQLEEKEIENLLRTNSIDHHYVAKTISAGNMFEVELYPIFNKKDFQEFKVKRKSRKAQKNLNDRNSRKQFIRLINSNFTKDDYIMHLTYSNENLPPSIEDAEKEVYKLIRKINYRRKKKKLQNAKYIYVTEYDLQKKIRVHHHLIIDGGIDRKVMKDLWTNGIRTKVEELEPDEYELSGLANYLSKDPKGKKRWKSSKGLKKPKERKSYTSFSKKKIRNMIADDTNVSVYMNSNYKSKTYLDHEIRYNKVNHMYYIYVRMRKKDFTEKKNVRRNIWDENKIDKIDA